jgi:hypothetical protein
MTYIVGRGVRVEIGSVEGAPKTVTAVTAANPGVATSSSHGLAAKSAGYFSTATGMPQLEGQAIRLNPVDTNTFTFENLSTVGYGTFTAGSFIPITTWLTLSNALDYNIGGGEADKLDVSVLLDDIKQEQAGLLQAQTVTFSARSETIYGQAMLKLEEVARAAGYIVMRITLKDGNVRVFRGQPSLPGEQVGQGQVGQGTFSMTLKGFVIQGVA